MSTISLPCSGDIASPPDLSHLLVLPYGCGEQNLVKLALNTAVTKYLQQTGGLSKRTVKKVQFNLQTGSYKYCPVHTYCIQTVKYDMYRLSTATQVPTIL